MSIYIGVTSPNPSSTTRERIVLASGVESNLIILKGANNNANILFDDNIQIGHKDGKFVCFKNDTNMFSIGATGAQFNTPVTMNSDLITAPSQAFSVGNLLPSNIDITAMPSAPFYLRAQISNVELLRATKDGLFYVNGSVGIGISSPLKALHVKGSSFFDNEIITGIIQHPTQVNNSILLNNGINRMQFNEATQFEKGIYIKEKLELFPGATFNLDSSVVNRMTVRSNTVLNKLLVTNTSNYDNFATIRLVHCNVMSTPVLDIKTTASDPIMFINHMGSLGIGTSDPLATLDVRGGMHCKTSEASSVFRIDAAGNVGIGTSTPLHMLHLQRIPSSPQNSSPMVALYNSSSITTPFAVAYSNEVPVFEVTTAGDLTVAKQITSASNVKTPRLEVGNIVASPGQNTIYLNNHSLSNIKNLNSQNLTVTELTSTSNLRTNYFFTSNFSILGLDVFKSQDYFQITTNTFYFPGSNILMSKSTNNLFANPTTQGKVRIDSDNFENGTTAIGLHVYGASNTGMRVSSQLIPYFYHTRTNASGTPQYEATYAINNLYEYTLQYSSLGTVNPVFIASGTQTKFGGNKVRVLSDGGLILMQSGDTVPESSGLLDVTGTVQFRGTGSSSILYTDTTNLRLGVRRTNPQYELDVLGSARITQSILTGANVGVGTLSPNALMHVHGSSYYFGEASFQSNVSVRGVLSTQSPITCTSDKKLKTNLLPIPDPSFKLEHMTGYLYDRIDTKRRECGLIAQEVMEVLPEVVQDVGGTLSISYGNMVALLVEGFKEMQKEIKDLKARVHELETR